MRSLRFADLERGQDGRIRLEPIEFMSSSGRGDGRGPAPNGPVPAP